MSDSQKVTAAPLRSRSENSRCEKCGASFHCGINDAQPCWCAADFPPLVSGEAGNSCLCPRCLGKLVSIQQAKASLSDE